MSKEERLARSSNLTVVALVLISVAGPDYVLDTADSLFQFDGRQARYQMLEWHAVLVDR